MEPLLMRGEESVFSAPSLYPHTRMLNPELPVSAK